MKKAHGLNLTTTITKRKDKEIIEVEKSSSLGNGSEISIGDTVMPFRSYNRNLIKILESTTILTGDASFQKTDGTYQTMSANMWQSILDTSTNYGLLAGTGTTPVDLTDYKLEAQIPNGTGAGQLTYGITGWSQSIATDSNTTNVTIIRSVTNNSTASISISELAFVVRYSSVYVLLSRDVFTPVSIAPGETKTLKIKLENSFSSTEGWNKNFTTILSQTITGSPSTLKDTGGADRISNYNLTGGGGLTITAGVGDASYGIRVGSGDTAFSPSASTLAAVIGNGTATGQLAYGAVNTTNGLYTATSIDGSTTSFRVGRSFSNNSGGDVTIAEIDLVIKVGYIFQLYRKVLATPLILGDGESVDIVLELSTSV